jgi:hypothetical protein
MMGRHGLLSTARPTASQPRFQGAMVMPHDRITSTACALDESEWWLPVPGWPGYEVSDNGRLRSCRNGRNRFSSPSERTYRIVRGSETSRGYTNVKLYPIDGGKTRSLGLHILVLEAFRGPRPPGYHACHFDGNPRNNRINNLRWDTVSANSIDALRHGRKSIAKLTESDIPTIWDRLVRGHLGYVIAQDYKVWPGAISRIRSGQRWSHITNKLPGTPPTTKTGHSLQSA